MFFSLSVWGPAILSTAVCALIITNDYLQTYTDISTTVGQIFAAILAYLIVFRTNLAFGRFFEGVNNVQDMFTKWDDAFVAIVVFIETSMEKHRKVSSAEDEVRKVRLLSESKAKLLHWFSILAALATNALTADAQGDGHPLEGVVIRKRLKDRSKGRGGGRGEDDYPSLYVLQGLPEDLKSNGTSRMTKVLGLEDAKRISGVEILGVVSDEELNQILKANNRVLLVVKWILLEIAEGSVSKIFLTPAPILTRVVQEISNGMIAFEMAMKIAVVPFPFPFAQVLDVCLIFFVLLLCPFVVTDLFKKERGKQLLTEAIELNVVWPTLVVNCLGVVGFMALNEIATELEEPFGNDDNDYPPHLLQRQMVHGIEDCYFGSVPMDFDIDAFTNGPVAGQPDVIGGTSNIEGAVDEHMVAAKFNELQAEVMKYSRELYNQNLMQWETIQTSRRLLGAVMARMRSSAQAQEVGLDQ